MYMTIVIIGQRADFLLKRQRRCQELELSSEIIAEVSPKRNLLGKEKRYYRRMGNFVVRRPFSTKLIILCTSNYQREKQAIRKGCLRDTQTLQRHKG